MMKTDLKEEYLSVGQLAERIPYKPKTIRNLMCQGVFVEGVHFTRLTGRPIFHALCHRSATPFAAGWRAAGKMHGQRADFKPTRPRVARRVVPDDIVYCRNPEGTRSVPRPRPGAKEHAS